MDCDHITKVLEWGHTLRDGQMNQYVALYGCTLCDATSDKPLPGIDEITTDHSQCHLDPCFGCKAKTLQLATGDAASNIIASGTTQKKWDKELNFYKEARAQGVQPEGTSTQAIQKALEASETLNKPYDANKMPKAKDINKATVEVMKEIGQI